MNTWLICLYITCQLVADVTATKIVPVFGLYVPSAIFIYAITFTLIDLMHTTMGKRAAQRILVIGAVMNVLMCCYFWFTCQLNSAPFWQYQESYTQILANTPRIVFASILAELISGLIDREVYHPFRHKRQWLGVILSNAASITIDSFVFIFVAFGGNIDIQNVLIMALGQITIKAIITVCSLPTTILLKHHRISK